MECWIAEKSRLESINHWLRVASRIVANIENLESLAKPAQFTLSMSHSFRRAWCLSYNLYLYICLNLTRNWTLLKTKNCGIFSGSDIISKIYCNKTVVAASGQYFSQQVVNLSRFLLPNKLSPLSIWQLIWGLSTCNIYRSRSAGNILPWQKKVWLADSPSIHSCGRIMYWLLFALAVKW